MVVLDPQSAMGTVVAESKRKACGMSGDRYAAIAASLRHMGWLQDRILYRARMAVVKRMIETGTRTVLDAGCGAGTLSRYLTSAGLQVLAVDSSPAMLQLARQNAPHLQWIQADIVQLELREPVDSAVIALSLHEMTETDRQAVWLAVQRMIRPDGVCVVMDYTPPSSCTLAGRVARWVIDRDERMVDRDDPGHYRNYLDFMTFGGARGWLKAIGAPIVYETCFLCGNLCVFQTGAEHHLKASTCQMIHQRLPNGEPP
jgi:ubiquinone/menaquinone biosynthesis C-methylase UbiE